MIGCEFMCEEIQERKKIVLPFLITTLKNPGCFCTLIILDTALAALLRLPITF